MNKVIKKVGSFVLIFLFTALVLYFSLKDNYEEIINQIININKFYLLLSFLLIICYWILKAIVMKISVRKFKSNFTFKEAFRLVLETNFFHAVTPFASGGQPYEIYSLTRSKLKVTEATNVSIQNFIVYQIALVFLGIIAVVFNLFSHIFPNTNFLKNLVTIGFLANLVVIIVLFIISFTKKLNKIIVNFIIKVLNKIKIVKDKEKTINNFEKYLQDFNEGAKILVKDKKIFILMILCNFLALILFYIIPYVLLQGITNDINMNIYECIITSAYIMMIGSFVPIPGGTGGLEYAFVVFYSNFITGPILNAVMLLWRFITYYFGMIVGAITLNIKRKKD
jgi:hypothetical protein